MKIFAVYDAVTGDMKRAGQCQDESFTAQAWREGEAVIALESIPEIGKRYRVEEGKLIEVES